MISIPITCPTFWYDSRCCIYIDKVVLMFPPLSNANWSICLQYEDEEHDQVVLASDSDLAAAVDHAKTSGLKVLWICCWSSLI